MKYGLVETGEDYVKVYPYSSQGYQYDEKDLYSIEKDIENHIDNIGEVEIVQEYDYHFKDEYADYFEKSLIELCTSMAYQRDLLEEFNSWTVWWLNKNKEKCSTYVNSLEELLEEVSKHKDIIISGNLTERQQILVDMARLLCD